MGNDLKEIIEGCMGNDRSSQFKLYKLLAPKLMLVCKRYMPNREEAEDALQEIFLKIYKKLDQYKWEGEFYGWARKLAVNTLINKYHQIYPKQSITNSIENINPGSYDNISGSLEKEDLMKMISLLPYEKRVVFNLHAIEGYEHKEIGEMLGISEVHSRNMLFHARKELMGFIKKTNEVYG